MAQKIFKISLIFIWLVSTTIGLCQRPHDFFEAKRQAEALFSNDTPSLFCQCQLDNHLKINEYSCGLQGEKPKHLAGQAVIAPLMPIEWFGPYFSCWRERPCLNLKGLRYGGKSCCRKKSSQFRYIEAELYNLWPVEALINNQLGDIHFIEEKSGERIGQCPIYYDKSAKTFTPSEKAKGILARAVLFMSEKYHIPLSKEDETQMFIWHQSHKPTEKEKAWAKKVAQIQGYENPYIFE